MKTRERVAAGWMRDQNGDLHVSPCEVVGSTGVRCTPQQHALIAAMLVGFVQCLLPHMAVIVETLA